MDKTRRNVLALIGVAPLAGFVLPRASAQGNAACFDPDQLPLSQKSRRRSLGYMESAADPQKRCGLCSFFTAGQGGCGSCAMLSGGPVTGAAVCNSFAPKSA